MRTITAYKNGVVAASVPGEVTPQGGGKRSDITGWSRQAANRNERFLYSVDTDQLDGLGLAVTLTLRDCPASADAWHRVRRQWEHRMRRYGMRRLHWVTEWQARGVPHLHCALYFPDPVQADEEPTVWGLPWGRSQGRTITAYSSRMRLMVDVIGHWIEAARAYGAGWRGQHVEVIRGAVGWSQYLAKHAARGVSHYQRQASAMPAAWQRTGRLWGKVGDWPIREPVRLSVTDEGWYRYRRMVRAWLVAQARRSLAEARTVEAARSARKRLAYVRRLLASGDPEFSRVRAVAEWVPEASALSFVHLLGSQGYSVESV